MIIVLHRATVIVNYSSYHLLSIYSVEPHIVCFKNTFWSYLILQKDNTFCQ